MNGIDVLEEQIIEKTTLRHKSSISKYLTHSLSKNIFPRHLTTHLLDHPPDVNQSMSEILFAFLQLHALLVISLGGGYEVSVFWAFDGKLVDIIVRAARVHRLHHVVPQVFAHLEK